MFKKTLGVALASLLLLLISITASAEPYKSKYITDIETNLQLDKTISLSSRSIILTVSYEEGSSSSRRHFPVDYLLRQIRLSESHILNFNRSLGLSTQDCRSNYNLNIFAVSNETMWEEGRFYSFRLRTNIGEERLIYGFYDSTLETPRENVLILTNVSSYENVLSVQHELSHYWFDRLCVQSNYSGSSESYALKYEAYVRRNYEDFN